MAVSRPNWQSIRSPLRCVRKLLTVNMKMGTVKCELYTEGAVDTATSAIHGRGVRAMLDLALGFAALVVSGHGPVATATLNV